MVLQVPVYLPEWLVRPARGLVNRLRGRRQDGFNLWGDRDVEISFIAGHLPSGPGRALDFGCGPGILSLIAAQRGFQVTALDLLVHQVPWKSPDVGFLQGDLLAQELPENSFDIILNCSAIEHVGLAGRYGIVQQNDEGDLQVMARLRALMKPGAMMLLTTPCGPDATFAPEFRVYGPQRLPRLLDGFRVDKECFWVKNGENRWQPAERNVALQFPAHADRKSPYHSIFALGCFVLKT